MLKKSEKNRPAPGQAAFRKQTNVMRITICTVLVWLAASLHTAANAQAPLTVDIENWVIYNFDVSDPSRLATNPAVTPPPTARNFISYVMIADIKAVGGKPVRGLLVRRGTRIDVQTAPRPGQAIGDVTRGCLDDGILEFLQTDGTPIGTITVLGFIFGPPPPGAPVAQTPGTWPSPGEPARFWECVSKWGEPRFQWVSIQGLVYLDLPPRILRIGAFSVDAALA